MLKGTLDEEMKVGILSSERGLKKLDLFCQEKEKAGRGISPLCRYVQALSMEIVSIFLN